MFLVGGGILVHGIPPVAESLHYLEDLVHSGVLGVLLAMAYNGVVGLIAGGFIVGTQSVIKRIIDKKPKADSKD